MLKYTLSLLVLLCTIGIKAQDCTEQADTFAQVFGDLDRDGMEEMVLLLNPSDVDLKGEVREIQVLKQTNGQWKVWQHSRKVLRPCSSGGMMGDPFQEVSIKDNSLILSYGGGGGAFRWSYTDEYQFRNQQFELVHYRASDYNYEYYSTKDDQDGYREESSMLDIDLTTGKVHYTQELSDNLKTKKSIVKEESFYKKGIQLNFTNRNSQYIKFRTPRYNTLVVIQN